jgi:spermidine/putrescine transport system substrate-binding protein
LNEPSAHRLSRRRLLQAAGGLAGLAGVATAAGCENTTTPVAAEGGGGSGRGIMGDPTAGGPVDSAGIPLARRDYPVRLPLVGDPVKTSAEPERGGVLRVYNYADYLNPAVLKEFGRREGLEVQVTTFETLDEAFSKLSTGGLKFDVIFSTPDQISRLIGRRLLQPLNHDLLPNLRKNVWPELHDPFYDVDSRYTVPYVTYTTGVGWRNDKLSFDPRELDQPWDAFWREGSHRGRTVILDDGREAIGMALMRRGVTDLNTEKPDLIDRARRDLEELPGVRIAISGYETLPTGRAWLHQVWSGDMLNAVISYLPSGTPPTVLSYWFQEDGGPVFNDVITIAADAEKPVMAHRFLNYLLDDEVAYENFVGYVGYQPPLNSIEPQRLLDDEIVPKGLSNALVSREAYATGNAFLTLSAEGQRLWDRAWSDVRGG